MSSMISIISSDCVPIESSQDIMDIFSRNGEVSAYYKVNGVLHEYQRGQDIQPDVSGDYIVTEHGWVKYDKFIIGR